MNKSCLRKRTLWIEKSIFLRIKRAVVSGNQRSKWMSWSVAVTCCTVIVRWLFRSCSQTRPENCRRTKSESTSSPINSQKRLKEWGGSMVRCWFHTSRSNHRCRWSTSISRERFGLNLIAISRKMTQIFSRLKKKTIMTLMKKMFGLSSMILQRLKRIPLWLVKLSKPRREEAQVAVLIKHRTTWHHLKLVVNHKPNQRLPKLRSHQLLLPSLRKIPEEHHQKLHQRLVEELELQQHHGVEVHLRQEQVHPSNRQEDKWEHRHQDLLLQMRAKSTW